MSDHKVIIVTQDSPRNRAPAAIQKVPTRRVTACSKVAFGEVMHSIQWEDRYWLQSCEEQFALFHATTKDLINSYFPVQMVKRCASDRPWVTEEFRSAVVKDTVPWNVAIYHRTVCTGTEWTQPESNSSQGRYYRGKVSELSTSNPRQSYRKVKQLTGCSKDESNL